MHQYFTHFDESVFCYLLKFVESLLMNVNAPMNSMHKSRSFEASENIEITKNTVKFGSSIYQFKNVTGFKVGEQPKSKIPFFVAFLLAFLGSIFYLIGNTIGNSLWLQFGQVSLALSALICYVNITQIPSYGLNLSLNSGEERFFVSKDKEFLMKIVNTLYDFMKTERDGVVNIDMSNRSVRINGNSSGAINLGDKSNVYSASLNNKNMVDAPVHSSQDESAFSDPIESTSEAYQKLLDLVKDNDK
jgi:hypothetical protein